MLLVNGRHQNQISVADRGFCYVDGLFETIAVVDSVPRLWKLHMQRLLQGCRRLGLAEPDGAQLSDETARVCDGAGDAVLKLIWSAGSGGRGYARGSAEPTRVVMRAPLPGYCTDWWRNGVAVRWCELRLAEQPLFAGIKHLNRLEQVMARAEWKDPSIAEGLLLTHNGDVIEGTMSNLFIVRNGVLMTPKLTKAGVAGVMRNRVIELAEASGVPVDITELDVADVESANEIFLTNSIIGIWPVVRLEALMLPVGALTRRLQRQLLVARDIPDWLQESTLQNL